jgi:hypothetical protein
MPKRRNISKGLVSLGHGGTGACELIFRRRALNNFDYVVAPHSHKRDTASAEIP